MRVFIAFDGSRQPFDVPPAQTVGAVKQMVKDHFLVQLSEDSQVRLELSHAGATLQDSWALADVGITPGSGLQCLLKEEQRAVVRVFNAVTGQTLSLPVLPQGGSVLPQGGSVAGLRSLVSQQTGLPVGAFRLSAPSGLQLYDCNRFHDYGVGVGSTLRLDTWDGWAGLLRGCFLGHKLTVQRSLSEERAVMRFQLRVALYIAASLGHLDLSSWLLQRGARAEEPVGVHPYRRWCLGTAHPDATTKSPAHAAAERGRLLVLKLFVGASVLTLLWGHDLLRLAVRHGHRECARHLGAKLCSSVPLLGGVAVAMTTYLRVKRWVRLGQRRAAAKARRHPHHQGALHPHPHHHPHSHQGGALRALDRSRVGDVVLVDGFSLPQMSTKPRRGRGRGEGEARTEGGGGGWVASEASSPRRPLTSVRRPPRLASFLPRQGQGTMTSSLELPKLLPVDTGSDVREKKRRGKKRGYGGKGGWKEEDKHSDEGRRGEEGEESLWRSRVPLPAVSRDTNPRPLFVSASSSDSSHLLSSALDSFSRHCGRTPRENALYCLALASAFTERPWLQQLDIARSLARRTIQNMG